MTVRTRIAPSPTGEDIHIGNLYTALINWAWAKKHHGQFVIRIEDTDRTRLVPGSEERIINSLKAYGLDPDESPETDTLSLQERAPRQRRGGEVYYGPYRQSERLDIYQEHIKKLIDNGTAYYCTCSKERLDEVRQTQQQQKLIPKYDRYCLDRQAEVKTEIEQGKPYVIRLKVPDRDIVFDDLLRGTISIHGKDMDDQVLMKSDGYPTYHLAVVIDDYLMKISHIIRAEEWLPSTPKHILLYEAFGWEKPIFTHVPILRNKDKSKLSKRKNPVWASWYLEQGILPQAMLNYLSLMGWTHPQQKDIFSLEEFIDKFDLKDMNTTGPIFDLDKLKWLNGKYIREMKNSDLIQHIELWAQQYLDKDTEFRIQNSEVAFSSKLQITNYKLHNILPLIQDRLEVLSDLPDLLKFLNPELQVDIDEIKKQSKHPNEEIKQLITNFQLQITNIQTWTIAEIEKLSRELKTNYSNWKPRDFFMTIRVATTGFPVTPPLFESIELLGKDLVTKRLEQVTSQI